MATTVEEPKKGRKLYTDVSYLEQKCQEAGVLSDVIRGSAGEAPAARVEVGFPGSGWREVREAWESEPLDGCLLESPEAHPLRGKLGWGEYLSEVGHREEALEAAQEAVKYHKLRSEFRPPNERKRGVERVVLRLPAPLTRASAASTLPAMPWKVSITDGAALDESAIRELWSFRLSIMRLKPHVPPEKDFAKFAANCRYARRVLRLRDSQGRLGSSLVPLVYDGSFQSERFRLVIPEYIYAVPELRGRAVGPWAWALSLVPLLYPPGVRVFLGGIGYPTGVLALESFMGPVWLYGEPQAPAQARQVLEWIVSNVAGDSWDPVSQQVDMNTIPSQPTEAWLARSQRRDLYRRYIERCPRWQEGRTVPCVCEYSTGKVIKAVLWAARRSWTHSPA